MGNTAGLKCLCDSNTCIILGHRAHVIIKLGRRGWGGEHGRSLFRAMGGGGGKGNGKGGKSGKGTGKYGKGGYPVTGVPADRPANEWPLWVLAHGLLESGSLPALRIEIYELFASQTRRGNPTFSGLIRFEQDLRTLQLLVEGTGHIPARFVRIREGPGIEHATVEMVSTTEMESSMIAAMLFVESGRLP